MVKNKPIIIMTFDTDWVPKWMIEDILDMLEDIPATFFVTDREAAETLSSIKTIESGIHPNFMPGSSHGNSPEEVVRHLLEFVPEAKSARSHNLVQDTTILNLFHVFGIEADLNNVEYRNPHIKSFKYWNGITKLPFNHEDGIAMVRQDGFAVEEWMLNASLFIPSFHPIHIALNSASLNSYYKLKNECDIKKMRTDEIAKYTNISNPGTRTFFEALIKRIKDKQLVPMTVIDYLKFIEIVFE